MRPVPAIDEHHQDGDLDEMQGTVIDPACCSCEEVGPVSRVHLLSGEVRSVTTALKVVEEVQEIEDE